jgi:hypothetical protein
MISEFYQLRRTAIKDIAAYLGFLIGFIGSAPFAWGLLAVQLDAGRFARGLWYFFGIVTLGGVFAGIAGMGLGIAAGLMWEQVHRYRRAARNRVLAAVAETDSHSTARAPVYVSPVEAPKLQLVTPSARPLPNIVGRRVGTVRFTATSVAVDFGGVTLDVNGPIAITSGGVRYSYPDAGSRDVLCATIGSRVSRVRSSAGGRVEIFLDNGSTLSLASGAVVETGETSRRINES